MVHRVRKIQSMTCGWKVCVFQSQIATTVEALIKTLPAVLRASGNAPEVAEAAAMAAWKHVAGEGLKDRAVPLNLEDRTLRVAVADMIWQKQLHAMRGQMLFRIN